MSDNDKEGWLCISPRPRFEKSGDGGLSVHAPAKINLNLLVGPRRSDGFHPLDSYVAKITLYDRIDLSTRSDGRIVFSCEGLDIGPDERNLALRAARLLAECAGAPGANVNLTKRIPPGKGLGGGSSDAAAVLSGLNELWGLGLSPADLAAAAIQLGSDVPLFLGPSTARMTGRGEILSPTIVREFFAILLLPGFACDTAEVYRRFDLLASPTRQAQLPTDQVCDLPPSQWRSRLRNQLAPAAIAVQPELGELSSRMAKSTGADVCMTGSGSALFVLFDDAEAAISALSALPDDLARQCLVVAKNPW